MRIGPHISYSKIHQLAEAKKWTEGNFFQVFLQSPRAFNIVKRDIKELKKIAQLNMKQEIGLVIHGSYLINLARSEGYQLKNAIRILKYDLMLSVHVGSIGVVIHMGKITKDMDISEGKAVGNFIRNIKNVLRDTDKRSNIILETGAGAGNEVGTDIETLGSIRMALTNSEKKRVKYCIDTCHIYSAGYDIGTVKGANSFIKLVEKNIGWNNVGVIHLNGSKTPLGGRVDRHADVFCGEIGDEGFNVMINYFSKLDIPMVLETPARELPMQEQIRMVKKVIKN